MQRIRMIGSAWLFTATLLLLVFGGVRDVHADLPDYCPDGIQAYCQQHCAIHNPGTQAYYQCLGRCACVAECQCDGYSEMVCTWWCQ